MEKGYSDALRRLARQAKNRLTGRNYMDGSGYKVYSGGLLADYKLVQISKRDDEILYEKVSRILSENIDIVNPIGKLVDKKKISIMSAQEKERYVFSIIDKYIKMKSRFEREHSNKVC